MIIVTLKDMMKDEFDDEVDILYKALESIELLTAMESDPTAMPGSSDSGSVTKPQSRDQAKQSQAAKELSKMHADSEKYKEKAAEDKAKVDEREKKRAEDEEANKQEKDKDNPKAREEFAKWIKEIVEVLKTVMSKSFTNFKTATSDMLADSEHIKKEIARIKKEHSIDPGAIINTWEYDDGYYKKFGDALTKALTDFKTRVDGYLNAVNSINATNEDPQTQKEIIEKLKAIFTDNPNMPDSVKVENDDQNKQAADPMYKVAALLGIKSTELAERGSSKPVTKSGEEKAGKKYMASTSKLENCILFHYHRDKSSQSRITVGNNSNLVSDAERFLMQSGEHIRKVNAEINQIQTVTNTYSGICDKVKRLADGIPDTTLSGQIKNDVNHITKGITSFMNLAKFKQTMLHERFFACEIIIKKAYNAEIQHRAMTKAEKKKEEKNKTFMD